MNLLLVAPKFPVTYWGFQYSLPFTGTDASLPPLGLVTLAALLPKDANIRLVDTNIQTLNDRDIVWADAVLVGGMHIQARSIHEIVARARSLGVRTVVGGPAVTTLPSDYDDADAIFLGEAEGREKDLESAITGAIPNERVFASNGELPSMETVSVPRFDLLDLGRYASMSIQYSRGCPYSCEFCDVIEIFGRRPRVKSNEQVITELHALHSLGYRGTLFFVDDNFIGNRPAVKRLLPEITKFQQANGFPFELYTEASLNLANDDELLTAMTGAGFNSVFVGIESPSAASLAGANKKHNLRMDLAAAVEKLSRSGIEVMGGFIVGFDQDTPEVFEAQRAFVAASGIPMAMIGLLMALPGTALARRLEKEGRLRVPAGGDQFVRPNFVCKMDEPTLLRGYSKLLSEVYAADAYYERCKIFVDRAPKVAVSRRVSRKNLATFARAVVGIGIVSPRRRHFWRLLWHAARRAPHNFSWAVSKTVMGEHLIRYTDEVIGPRMRQSLVEVARESYRVHASRDDSEHGREQVPNEIGLPTVRAANGRLPVVA